MWVQLKNRIRKVLEPRAVILMYHQVAERKSDPWDLAVTQPNFEQQMDAVHRDFNIVSLEELAECIRRNKLYRRMLAISFDDGCFDNYTNARPVLSESDFPATFFCSTHACESGEQFWWEELENILLHADVLPSSLKIEALGRTFFFDLKKDARLNEQSMAHIRSWRVGQDPVNERERLFLELWKYIQPLPHAQQRGVVDSLYRWANIPPTVPKKVVMSATDLRSLSSNRLFSVGAHTVHHAMLAEHGVETQLFEVSQSKKTLESWLRKSVNSFAYPYGNYNDLTRLLLMEAGYNHAVSTQQRAITAHDDVFQLPRIQVKNWNGKRFSENLNRIMSL